MLHKENYTKQSEFQEWLLWLNLGKSGRLEGSYNPELRSAGTVYFSWQVFIFHPGEESYFPLNNSNYSCPSNSTSRVSLLSTNLIRVYKLLPCQFIGKDAVIYPITSGENHNSLKLELSTKMRLIPEKGEQLANDSGTVSFFPCQPVSAAT